MPKPYTPPGGSRIQLNPETDVVQVVDAEGQPLPAEEQKKFRDSMTPDMLRALKSAMRQSFRR